jgi:predicted nucleic acid-binding protein
VIHLDTSFLILAMTTGSPEDRRLRGWLLEGEPVGISAVSWAEFLCGPVDADNAELANRIVGEPLGLLGVDARLTARLFNLGGRRRGSLVDCMIAATAVRAGAALATRNPADFRRLEPAGLRIVAD